MLPSSQVEWFGLPVVGSQGRVGEKHSALTPKRFWFIPICVVKPAAGIAGQQPLAQRFVEGQAIG